MKKYILALDQGTTSSRALLFDKNACVVAMAQKETIQHFPFPGWVEQDPREIWANQLFVAKKVLKDYNIKPGEIAAIGITNQRETTVVWDKQTGKPVYHAIIWQDKRTADYCHKLKQTGQEKFLRKTTGLLADSYFSASKINWILRHVPGAKRRAAAGELLFGTIDTWLLWNLTGGNVHATDYSNASRTLLFNIHEKKWDEKLAALFDVPLSMLPVVRDSSGVFGKTERKIFGEEILVSGIAGDQQAALFGQNCLEAGMAKNTYGTGCFMLMNTGIKPVVSKAGLLTTIAWGIDGNITYALEGSVFMAGAVMQWLRDKLNIIKNVVDSEKIAMNLENNGGVYIVPAFSGLGAPYWDMNAKGLITGLTQGSSSAHIVRAALEAIAYQVKDLLNAMEKDSGIESKLLRVDGGAAANNFLMQFQSDILDKPIHRPCNVEATALGAARLAAIACDFWKIGNRNKAEGADTVFKPSFTETKRRHLYKGWKNAVRSSRL
ncbi:MAG: glycerol kinase GlpK [Bacteroidota bacterium]